MELSFEIDEKELRKIIADYIGDRINITPDSDMIHIKVKSKQNYKSEWEDAAFKATFSYKI